MGVEMSDIKLEYILSSPDVDDGIYFDDKERDKFIKSCSDKGIFHKIDYPLPQKLVYKTKIKEIVKYKQNYIKTYPTWLEFIKYKFGIKK
jgi:hypothetical protein